MSQAPPGTGPQNLHLNRMPGIVFTLDLKAGRWLGRAQCWVQTLAVLPFCPFYARKPDCSSATPSSAPTASSHNGTTWGSRLLLEEEFLLPSQVD